MREHPCSQTDSCPEESGRRSLIHLNYFSRSRAAASVGQAPSQGVTKIIMRSHSHSHRGRRGWSLTLGDNASSTGHGKHNEAVKTPMGERKLVSSWMPINRFRCPPLRRSEEVLKTNPGRRRRASAPVASSGQTAQHKTRPHSHDVINRLSRQD